MKKIAEVQDKIRIFEQSLNSQVSEEEIMQKLLVLCNNVEIPIEVVNWQTGTKFYRARILKNSDLNQLKNWDKSDFWSLPKNNIYKYGRLNHVKESVLYLSNDFNQTLKEVRFDPNKKLPVVISCFKVKQSFGSVHIGGDDPKDSSENNLSIIKSLYTDFFRSQFSKPVGIGTEYLYFLSNGIAKTFYDLPIQVSKAWTYNAVDNYNFYNVAFKANISDQILDYKGSVVVKEISENGLTIPLMFNEKYQLCLSNNEVINSIFNLRFQA
ncbi:hypothetical protein [Leuconostoc falkenbergense]|uniref:hypothetical protein n=1 Tax=Leuconostoc falkenbergense TaxID=2766470 RepID=UPI003BB0918C